MYQEIVLRATKKLRNSLGEFVNDYPTWPTEQQNALLVVDLNVCMIGKPESEYEKKYGSSLPYWVNCKIANNYLQRQHLIICLEYIKQKKS